MFHDSKIEPIPTVKTFSFNQKNWKFAKSIESQALGSNFSFTGNKIHTEAENWKSAKPVESPAFGSNFSFTGNKTCTEADLNSRSFQSNIRNNSQKRLCIEASSQRLCIEASTQTDVLDMHTNKLGHGLESLLKSGNYSDININVKDKEFKLHKNILTAHSPVFAALVDKQTFVNIDEANPDVFADFLHFIYAGNTEKLNSDNVINMYGLAKKYQVLELSALCVNHMMSHISLENFCDILSLSLQHHDDKLFEVASQYFVENSIDIAETPKWLAFLKENSTTGNLLFLKALKSKKKSVASV